MAGPWRRWPPTIRAGWSVGPRSAPWPGSALAVPPSRGRRRTPTPRCAPPPRPSGALAPEEASGATSCSSSQREAPRPPPSSPTSWSRATTWPRRSTLTPGARPPRSGSRPGRRRSSPGAAPPTTDPAPSAAALRPDLAELELDRDLDLVTHDDPAGLEGGVPGQAERLALDGRGRAGASLAVAPRIDDLLAQLD